MLKKRKNSSGSDHDEHLILLERQLDSFTGDPHLLLSLLRKKVAELTPANHFPTPQPLSLIEWKCLKYAYFAFRFTFANQKSQMIGGKGD